MEDKKVTNSELLRLRRTMELREFALAEFYPQSNSGTAAHRKLTDDELPLNLARPLRSRSPDNPDPPESVAKPWKKPWDK